ncbi:MAG TPA: TetR/AcrR family transcriptional regulator [Acetobacteraceae bacterium]|nr:TetR/AcrR family transcriptional regulator [Acetobacteraceae bacterium]
MEARRGRILEEAGRLLSAGGIEELTVRALAQQARVTVPTIYNLIGAKEAIVAALVAEALDRLDATMAALPAARGIARGQAAVRANLDLCFSEPCRYRALYRSLTDPHASCAPFGQLFRRAGEVFTLAVREAVADEDLHGRLLALPLGHHILHGLIETFRLWGTEALSVAATEARASYVLLTGFMADATKQGRRKILERLQAVEVLLDN